MFIVKYRKIWFAISGLLVLASLFAIFAYGFRLSVDFTGGSITEVRYEGEFPAKDQIDAVVVSMDIGGFSVRPSGEDGYIIRTRELTDAEKEELESTLLGISSTRFTIERQNTVGPVAGAELQTKAVTALIVVVIMIVLFVAFAFRQVSKPVSSWKYAISAIIALAHDIIIPAGAFAVLGFLMGIEVDLLFVVGLLAILGYSVNDTIIVFDRVRENLRHNRDAGVREDFEETVGRSVTQTLGRSINTSVTLFVVLLFLYFMGSSATKDFSLLLIIGVVVGTYSSIFLASPLLVSFYKRSPLARPK